MRYTVLYNNLKRCPFCKQEAKLLYHNAFYSVRCTICGAQTAGSIYPELAVKRWNRRGRRTW